MLKLGIIGCGKRGRCLLRDVFLHLEKVKVTALCDVYKDKMDELNTMIKEKHSYDAIK